MNSDMSIIDEISNYKVVSFDIYDTLLYRATLKPTDVFDIVEQEYNNIYGRKIDKFKAKRIGAENKARIDSGEKEITLKQIYNYIDYDDKKKEVLYELECKIEESIVYANEKVRLIYDYCKENGKDIIITSDMYLPKECIEEILMKVGIDEYKFLYLSSEKGLTKRSGKLFEYILKDLKINNSEIIHLGNDINTDFIPAVNKGIMSIILDLPDKRRDYWNVDVDDISLNHLRSCIMAVDRNRSEVSDSYKIGYKVIGPFISQFCIWMHEIVIKENFSKIIFMAREGYLIYLTYKEMYPEEADRICYLKINRNTLTLPMLSSDRSISNFVSILRDYHLFSNTASSLMQLLHVEVGTNEKKAIANKHGLELDSVIQLEMMQTDERFIGFYEECIDLCKSNLDQQYLLLERYLKQNGISVGDKVALVNNSMHGTAQRYLSNLFVQHDFWGIQFICIPRAASRLNNKVLFWFDQKCSQYEKRLFYRNSLIIEHLLFEDSGTALFYEDGLDGVHVICEERGSEVVNDFTLRKFREGTIDFVKMYMDTYPMKVKPQFCLRALVQLLINPSIKDAQIIGSLIDSDKGKSKTLIINGSKKDIFKFIIKKRNTWVQGELAIREERIWIKIYNCALRIELIKKVFT